MATLGHLPALTVTPASADERTPVAALAEQVHAVTGQSGALALVDQGYPGEAVAATAAAHGLPLQVVPLPEAKHGFVLLPRRWVVERRFAGTARFRRLARDAASPAMTSAFLASWRVCTSWPSPASCSISSSISTHVHNRLYGLRQHKIVGLSG